MILEIDWGNSRIKWRLVGDSGRLAADTRVALDLQELAGQLRQRLSQSSALLGIRVASVRPASDDARLADWALQQWQLRPWFARASRQCGGVVSAYPEFARLGVDRWLGLLAARQSSNAPAVIIQAGTALTADLLAAQGQHKGGFIAPGWQTMRRALSVGTAQVRSTSAPPECFLLGPASSTEGAVEAGISAMVQGFVRNACEQLSAEARLLVAGGDASVICRYFSEAEYWPDLVLDGLAVAHQADSV